MNPELKPYPAYRDSGVPWLGEVPEHWEARRLASCLASLQSGAREQTEIDADEGVLDSLLPWLGPYPELTLIPGDGRSKNIPFGMTIYHGDFIRRVQ